jgi:SulP family sulfate permease
MNHSIDDTNPEQLESKRPYSLASLLPGILAGLIIGLVFIGQAAAFAAFMFSGELSPALSIGIPVVLLAIVAMVLIGAWRSTYPSTVSAVQESGLAVIAVATAGVIGQMGEASLEAKVATAVSISGGSTLFRAGVFWAMGRFRLGSFVYFLPYPVLAGFLAVSGWFLLEGGLNVVTGSHSITGMVQAMKAP